MNRSIPFIKGKELVHLPSHLPASVESATELALNSGQTVSQMMHDFNRGLAAHAVFMWGLTGGASKEESWGAQRLAEFTGSQARNSLLTVGNFSMGVLPDEDDIIADSVVNRIRADHKLHPPAYDDQTLIGILPMVSYASSMELPHLNNSVRALDRAFRRQGLNSQAETDDPIYLPKQATRKNPGPAYNVVSQRVEEFKIKMADSWHWLFPGMPISLILVANAGRPSKIFKGMPRGSLELAGIGRLNEGGNRYKNLGWRMLDWVGLSRSRPVAARPTETVRESRFQPRKGQSVPERVS